MENDVVGIQALGPALDDEGWIAVGKTTHAACNEARANVLLVLQVVIAVEQEALVSDVRELEDSLRVLVLRDRAIDGRRRVEDADGAGLILFDNEGTLQRSIEQEKELTFFDVQPRKPSGT